MQQSIYTIDYNECPKCHKFLQEDLVPGQGICWKMSCTRCSFEKFNTCCPKCMRTFAVKQSSELADGLPLKCPYSDCNRYFQILNCPVPTCKQVNFFLDRSYQIGQVTNCKTCMTQFQQVACPHCLVSNYWKGTGDSYYKMGEAVECYSCHKNFSHVACPKCNEAKYFTDSGYSFGSKQICKGCDYNFHQVACQECHYSNNYEEDKFKYGVNHVCQNKLCKKNINIIACPGCNKGKFKDMKEFGKKEFLVKDECEACKTSYTIYPCNKCQSSLPIRWDNLKTGLNNFVFASCEGEMHICYKCGDCQEISVDSDVCRKCPAKVVVPEKPKPEVKVEDAVEEKMCCVCLDNPPETAFVPCGHKKTCAGCSDKIFRTSKQCPCCRVKVITYIKVYE